MERHACGKRGRRAARAAHRGIDPPDAAKVIQHCAERQLWRLRRNYVLHYLTKRGNISGDLHRPGRTLLCSASRAERFAQLCLRAVGLAGLLWTDFQGITHYACTLRQKLTAAWRRTILFCGQHGSPDMAAAAVELNTYLIRPPDDSVRSRKVSVGGAAAFSGSGGGGGGGGGGGAAAAAEEEKPAEEEKKEEEEEEDEVPVPRCPEAALGWVSSSAKVKDCSFFLCAAAGHGLLAIRLRRVARSCHGHSEPVFCAPAAAGCCRSAGCCCADCAYNQKKWISAGCCCALPQAAGGRIILCM